MRRFQIDNTLHRSNSRASRGFLQITTLFNRTVVMIFETEYCGD